MEYVLLLLFVILNVLIFISSIYKRGLKKEINKDKEEDFTELPIFKICKLHRKLTVEYLILKLYLIAFIIFLSIIVIYKKEYDILVVFYVVMILKGIYNILDSKARIRYYSNFSEKGK